MQHGHLANRCLYVQELLIFEDSFGPCPLWVRQKFKYTTINCSPVFHCCCYLFDWLCLCL